MKRVGAGSQSGYAGASCVTTKGLGMNAGHEHTGVSYHDSSYRGLSNTRRRTAGWRVLLLSVLSSFAALAATAKGGASMRRVSFAVLPSPAGYRGEGVMPVPRARPGARRLALLGAVMLRERSLIAVLARLRWPRSVSIAGCLVVLGVLWLLPSAANAAGGSTQAASSWSIQSIPIPSEATGPDLTGVSCSSASACTVIGGYGTANAFGLTLIERWDGARWTIQSPPNSTSPRFLKAVSCPSSTACTAVGYFDTATGQTLTLAMGWNGTQWKIEPTPNPTGSTFNQLTAVSCTSANACTAVGVYFSSAGPALTLAERWNGTSWTIQDTPNASTRSNTFNGISCTSATACIATGDEVADNPGFALMPLAERWDGSRWLLQNTPSPPDAKFSALGNVSCTSASACTAVGNYSNTAGSGLTLAEHWNGTSWSIETTPDPSGGTGASLNGVSCPSGFECAAVGEYNNSAGARVTLAERFSAARAAIQSTPNPIGGTGDFLSAVSCASESACTAVGSYQNSAGTSIPLVERYS
jgi:hypothetical protein